MEQNAALTNAENRIREVAERISRLREDSGLTA